MNRFLIRMLSLICVMLMFIGTVGLVACQTPQDNGNTTTAADTTTDAPSSPDDPKGTTAATGDNTEPGGNMTWLGNFDEKRVALSHPYGRVMSIAWGGDSVNYPVGSKKAVTEAICMGVDAIGIYVKKTKDGELVAIPETDLYDFTNFRSINGTNGLPTGHGVSNWTWEQLQELRYLNADGTTSSRKIMKLSELVELCHGKCFVYIKNCDEFMKNDYDVLYEIAKSTESYSAFLMTPGVTAISKWATLYQDDAKLADFLSKQCDIFFRQVDYFNLRTTVQTLGGEKYPDEEKGYRVAYTDQKNLLVTKRAGELVKWIEKNAKSALEYVPSVQDTLKYSIAKKDLTARYLIISDIHYTPVEQPGYLDRVTYRGYSTVERMTKMCAEIEEEYNLRGLDAIFILGDLTTDDWPARDSVWLGDLFEKYLDPLSEKLGIPILAVGGNHDSHINDMWKPIVGQDREFVWENPKTGDVFIMVDTFNPLLSPSTGPSGAGFTGNNLEWIEEQLEKYKNRNNIFICSHKFDPNDKLIKLISNYENVKALFDGHSHHHSVTPLKTTIEGETIEAGACLINAGNYAYGAWGDSAQYGYSFDFHDERNVWGYNIVEMSGSKTITYRIDVEAFYSAKYSSSGKTDIRVCQPFVKNEEVILK